MATFPSITPTYSFSKNTSPNVRKVVFGDGFEQRLSFGINQNPKTYSLEFRVSETESDVIEAFLNSRAFDNESFNFTPLLKVFLKQVHIQDQQIQLQSQLQIMV